MTRKHKYFINGYREDSGLQMLYRCTSSTTGQPIYEYWSRTGKKWVLSSHSEDWFAWNLQSTSLRAARPVFGGEPFKLTA